MAGSGGDGPAIDIEQMAEAGDGDADHLLDRILRNALGGDKGDDGVKGEGVKGEGVKGEGAKNEAKGEAKGESKNELALKTELAIKNEVKGVKLEKTVKREPGAAPELGALDKRKKDKKRSRSRSKKKKRSRSRRRKRSKSRKRRRSSSSSRSASKSPVQAAIDGLPQARVVAVRGHWAQYLSPAGETFYKNVLNGEVQWQKPGNFDCQPSRRAGEMTPAPGEAACYIFNMPPEWSEADLMQLFAPFGQVTSSHVQRDANGFSRSCGFVTYTSPDAAQQATNMMNGFGVDGKFLKVSLTQFSLGNSAPGGPGAPGGAPGGPLGGPAVPGLKMP
mmetsp:Transcript_59742/g.155126  ORF Transcript_59742/g.155126 Transcript_59742/m.155126 type:complete len:333 (-) Transcript_59742:88-1086(-)